ncbi:hypothetical protein LSH36_113g00021 [Paralvinella palmiformis]|uniref:G-protein coupled receptors family 1 profile domain-containing protein n=1 Tax=Paralvinella palmiformis TaxID=53620 RepID=A0AAD9NB21_9ANNE|nr:hypothetical protein LSH36_113g00021 [Paralvinella palmiformis]
MEITLSPFEVAIAAANVSADADNVTSVAPYKMFYENARFVTGLICYPIMCLLGLCGNVFILLVFSQKTMHTSTNIFLSALAVSDIIKLLNDFLYFLTILLLETSPDVGNQWFGYLYPYAHYFFNTAVCVSAWLTVSVALERYILVCHPARSKTWTSIPRAKLISALCFVTMMMAGIPHALRYRTIKKVVVEDGVNVTRLDVVLTDLWRNQRFVLGYNWLQSLLRSMIPLVVLVITSSFIINALRRTRANKRMASRNKITIMLIIVIIFFLVCIIPDAVMSGFFNFGYVESDDYLVKGVREITDMLLGINAAINYVLYMTFNKIFREQFMVFFCRRCADAAKKKEEQRYRRLSEGRHLANGAPPKTNAAGPAAPAAGAASTGIRNAETHV